MSCRLVPRGSRGWRPAGNWGRTVGCNPERTHAPGSEDELAALIAQAAASGGRVKVVGSGHSWTDIACTDRTHLRLEAMDDRLEIAPDRRSAWVPAGMRLSSCVEALAKEGLALPNLGSIAAQTVGGVVATGTHGTGIGIGNLSSFVLGMRIVDGTGRIRSLSPEQDGDDFRDARVHLGALGVVTRLRFRVVPAFRLRERLRLLPFETTLSPPRPAGGACPSQLWWPPGTDDVQVYASTGPKTRSGPGACGASGPGCGSARPLRRSWGFPDGCRPWFRCCTVRYRLRPGLRERSRTQSR